MACRKVCQQIIRSSVPRRQQSTTATVAETSSGCPFHFGKKVQPETYDGEVKPYAAIPAAKGLPFIGTMYDILKSGGAAKIHEHCDMRHRELGPIFREKLGAVEAVVLASKDHLETVYNKEGIHPLHLVPEPWEMYNKLKGLKRGLFFMDGQEWWEKRSVLNQMLMSPRAIAKWDKAFNGIVHDVIHRWKILKARKGDNIVPNLERELYNWSIESLGKLMFGRRLNCVAPPDQESEMQEFVSYVQKIFGESSKMTIIPPKLAYALKLPVWRRFVNAADNALRLARAYTEARIAEIESMEGTGKAEGLLADLVANKDIPRDELVNIISDLILAAADTTSHATQWALYSLAKNPECQEKLLEEINKVVPPGEDISSSHLGQIGYSAMIIKETLRLYPIASFLTRILPNKIVLGGYEIPAGKLVIMSQYTMGRDPELFTEPEKFKPERWSRQGVNPHMKKSTGCLPFGSGTRSCIGKRVAELKMRLLILEVVRNFKLHTTSEVGISMRMITTPDKPIQLHLEERT